MSLSENLAAFLTESCYKRGDVLAIALPNLPEYAIALLGALRAGLAVTPVNPVYNAEEIGYQLGNSGANIVVTYPERSAVVEAGAERAVQGGLPLMLVGSGGGRLLGSRDLLEVARMEPPTVSHGKLVDQGNSAPSKQLALLPYSSGTTGIPKGVRLTHGNVTANNSQISHPSIKFVRDTTKEFQDVIPCVLPFFHIYGLTVTMLSYLKMGAKLVTLPRFEPESFLKVLKDYKTTILHVVPPLVQFMASHPGVTPAHLDTLRATVNGAASISVQDAERLLTKKKHVIVSGYGLTETSPAITSAHNTSTDLDTVGSPLSDTQIKIIDPQTGLIQDPNRPGEICCRGPQVMSGYHNNEEATSETLKGGWLHTGDVGYFKKGQLYIVERLKELIKVKGFQVAPVELEEILKGHPSVADVAVVGKPDRRSGELPVAFVVLNNAARVPTKSEIKEYLAARVAEYKRLDAVAFVQSIPKSSTGKILRRELRETLAEG
ncbi:hypothetical protein AAG570_009028 [Ranatra chinensis]|uniref:4-coumarate--CoA ligase n=1 Tax=Ranatra chinensis TaxID=642074 RepID=A0ABD0Z5G0_9HEMI